MLLVLHRLSVDSKVLQGCRKRRELFRHDSTNSLSLSQSTLFHSATSKPHPTHSWHIIFLFVFSEQKSNYNNRSKMAGDGVCLFVQRVQEEVERGLWLSDCWRRSSLRSSPFVLTYKSAFVCNCCHKRRHSVRCLRFEQQTRHHHNGPGWSTTPRGCWDGMDNELKPAVLNLTTTLYVLHYDRIHCHSLFAVE